MTCSCHKNRYINFSYGNLIMFNKVLLSLLHRKQNHLILCSATILRFKGSEGLGRFSQVEYEKNVDVFDSCT